MNEIIYQDSISFFIEQSRIRKNPKDARLFNLSKAYILSSKVNNDSIKIKYLLKIISGYYDLGDFDNFNSLNEELLDLAINQSDSTSVADYHWNKGNYFAKIEILDSAYYHYGKAQNIF